MSWELVPAGTNIDFMGRRRLAAGLSAALLLASVAAIPINGIRLGVDFAGGSEIQVEFASGVPASDGAIRAVLTDTLEIADASVIRYGEVEDNAFLIKFKGDINLEPGELGEEPDAGDAGDVVGTDLIVALEKALDGAIGSVEIQRVEFVGPRVGAELAADGAKALFYASLAILIYIAFRFNTRFAPGAIVAVLHDLSITAGIFVILGMEFDLRILAALLAILGYSLNDTIIIYDRVRENLALHTSIDLPEVLNQSVNQTLSRTVLTSGTTLVALLSLYFLGGEVIRPFALAMILGVLVGTYSSIYIAAPVLLLLERRFGAGAAAEVAAKERSSQAGGKAKAAGKGKRKAAGSKAGKGKTGKGKAASAS